MGGTFSLLTTLSHIALDELFFLFFQGVHLIKLSVLSLGLVLRRATISSFIILYL